MPFSNRIREARKALADRRTERVEYRRLSDELASFQTPAERSELDQMLSRHSAEETQQIREILNRQDYERQRSTSAVGGRRA